MLMEAVRGYPCLWQVSSPVYRDLRAKDNAWKVVATVVGAAVDECCAGCSLRDRYVRDLRKVRKWRTGDPGPPPESHWPLFEPMGFLEENSYIRYIRKAQFII